MGRKRRERKTPKRPKMLYSIRVDGELDGLIKSTLQFINRRGAEGVIDPAEIGPGYTLTELVNAILYDVFFDFDNHNIPRDFAPLVRRLEWQLMGLALSREMVDEFFDVPPAEVQALREQQEQLEQQKKNTP